MARFYVLSIIGFIFLSPSLWAKAPFSLKVASQETGCEQECVVFKATLVVPNRSFEKRIFWHYSTADSDGWQKVEGEYERPTQDPEQEIWVVEWEFPKEQRIEFAFSYEMGNGTTLWDNQNGSNYVLDGIGETLGIHQWVGLAKANWLNGKASSVAGVLMVRNIAYQKSIEIHYSFDRWKTKSVTQGFFESEANEQGIERWGFLIDNPDEAPEIDYVIRLEAQGQVVWEDNQGLTYRL